MRYIAKNIPIAAVLAALCAALPPARAAADPAMDNVLDRDALAARQWKENLGLSAEQTPRFLAAVKAKDAGLQPLREQLRAGMRKLQSQLSENAAESEVQDSLQQLVKVRKAIAARKEQFDAALAAFLSQIGRAHV